jgi:hypothetical protein
VAVFGDMGNVNANGTKRALRQLREQQGYDWIWHIGDIAYADDAFMAPPYGSLRAPSLKFKYEEVSPLKLRGRKATVACPEFAVEGIGWLTNRLCPVGLQWYDDYMQSIEHVAARVAYQVLPGNHEAECKRLLLMPRKLGALVRLPLCGACRPLAVLSAPPAEPARAEELLDL